MIGYGWILSVAWICISLGAAMALSAWIVHDKHKDKIIKKLVMDDDSWCSANCRHYAECYINHKDPDDAWKKLEEYCYECPMAKAIYEWEVENETRKRSRS